MSNFTLLKENPTPRHPGSAQATAGLRPHERRLLFVALPLLVAVRIGACLLPLRHLNMLLMWLAELNSQPQAHPDYALRAARAVEYSARFVPGVDSLAIALATLTLLRRRGLTGHLRRGIRCDSNGALHNHAWLEYNGRIIVGGPALLVAQFTSHPSLHRDTL